MTIDFKSNNMYTWNRVFDSPCNVLPLFKNTASDHELKKNINKQKIYSSNNPHKTKVFLSK